MRLCLLLFTLFFFTGCASVSSRQLVGSQPYVIDDAKVWTGDWVILTDGNAQPVVIQVADAATGLLRMTYIQTPSAADAKADSYPTVSSCLIQLRAEGSRVMGNMHTIEEFSLGGKTSTVEMKDEFLWFLLEVGAKGQMVAIIPNAETIGAMVENHQLRGEKKEGSVVLEGMTSDELKAVLGNAEAMRYTTPMTIIRLPQD